ncbi:MAG TPA: hypothetical protein GXX75_26965 [Clostridiales bacterium]|nr:hypothetical protein [Clostridiales bacterium]
MYLEDNTFQSVTELIFLSVTLKETYHVSSGIFGSCRRGEEHEGSDVDIQVKFSEAPGSLGSSGLKVCI